MEGYEANDFKNKEACEKEATSIAVDVQKSWNSMYEAERKHSGDGWTENNSNI